MMAIEPTTFLVHTACSFAWVGLDLLRKLLAGRGPTLSITFLLLFAHLPLFLLWAVVDGRWQVASGYWLPGLGCIVVNLGASLTYMHAVRLSGMSATLPLLSLTPVFTTLLAIPLLGEWPGPVGSVRRRLLPKQRTTEHAAPAGRSPATMGHNGRKPRQRPEEEPCMEARGPR
jgi:uncharacterized membrane protein